MSGINKQTNELLFNGITMKVAIEKGYTLNDFKLVRELHNKLVKKYHSLDRTQRAMLRAKAEEYLNERIANLSKSNTDTTSTEATDTNNG